MKIQESAENYLETIYMLSRHKPYVRSIDIANELSFSKPSVSVAMKNLRENGYIRMDEQGHITLTETGQSIADVMYERHILLSNWLIYLGVDPQTAAESFEAIKKHITQGNELPKELKEESIHA